MKCFNLYIRICVFLYFGMIFYIGNDFYFMILNLFLAYIPFELSVVATKLKSKVLIILTSCLWLLFYPNAPYLLTDFFHLEFLNIYVINRPFNNYLGDWANFSLLSFGILFGFLIGLISLNNILTKIQEGFIKKNALIISSILIVFITLSSGYAIYLGRFARLHSHYIFNNPTYVINTIFNNINYTSICFSILMAAIQIPIIILFVLFKNELLKNKSHNNNLMEE